MNSSRKAASYVPSTYDGFTEMGTLVDVCDARIDEAESAMSEIIDNQWLSTAQESGIEYYENLLGIIPDPSVEDLEFRRSRLINRFSSKLPFTVRSLEQRLDAIIGKGNYILTIDHNEYIIYLESSSVNQVWYTETMITINGMKPCNMVFINTPLINAGIQLSETISYSNRDDNYVLGSGFKLGEVPFAYLGDEVVVKMANMPSIAQKLLNDVAKFTSDSIVSVMVHNKDYSELIIDFTTKQVDENVITIEYDVPATIGVEITSISIHDGDSNTLAEFDVYIPMSSGVKIKHTILVKEG